MGESVSCQGPRHNFGNLPFRSETQPTMSEEHFDEFEHYNFDQDKAMRSGHSDEIKVCLVTISLHVMRMMHSTTMFRKAANKEGGIDEHKQTQSWRPREEDS